MQQSETFDHVAELYDASRPGYPPALFDEIVRIARLEPDDPVLEVGCGTGQATQGLRRRGLAITAVDPGRELIRLARLRFGDNDDMAFVTARFEDWTPPRAAYRLVASAQAWHRVEPNAGFAKAADALAPRGVLAVFGNVPGALSSTVADAIEPILAEHGLTARAPPPESWYLPAGPVASLFHASGRFEPATHTAFPWIWRTSLAAHMDFLRSRSDFQILPEASRAALLGALEPALRSVLGDDLALPYEAHLYWARKRPA